MVSNIKNEGLIFTETLSILCTPLSLGKELCIMGHAPDRNAMSNNNKKMIYTSCVHLVLAVRATS